MRPWPAPPATRVEIAYAIDYLTGQHREPRFHAVTLALGAEMLVAGGLAADRDAAAGRLEPALASGRAAEKLRQMVAALGGPADLLERPDRYLPKRRCGGRSIRPEPSRRSRRGRSAWR